MLTTQCSTHCVYSWQPAVLQQTVFFAPNFLIDKSLCFAAPIWTAIRFSSSITWRFSKNSNGTEHWCKNFSGQGLVKRNTPSTGTSNKCKNAFWKLKTPIGGRFSTGAMKWSTWKTFVAVRAPRQVLDGRAQIGNAATLHSTPALITRHFQVTIVLLRQLALTSKPWLMLYHTDYARVWN